MPLQQAVPTVIPIRQPSKKENLRIFSKFSIFKSKNSKSRNVSPPALPSDSEGIESESRLHRLHILYNRTAVEVEERGIDSATNAETSTDSLVDKTLSQMASEEILDLQVGQVRADSFGAYQSMDGNTYPTSISTSTLSTERSSSIFSPKRQSTQDSIATSMSSRSTQSKVNVPHGCLRISDPIITPVLQIPLLPSNTPSATGSSGSDNGMESGPSSAQPVYGGYRSDRDLPPRYSAVIGPTRRQPSRSGTSDESDLEDEIPTNELLLSSGQDKSNSVRLGKQPANAMISGITGFWSPLFLVDGQSPSIQPESSSSASLTPRWLDYWGESTCHSTTQYSGIGTLGSIDSFTLQGVDEYSFDDQDIEDNKLFAETLQRLEEEDRVFAEDLQRIEEMDFLLAQEWQEEEDEQLRLAEEREEHFRLEEISRIASEDAILAAELARQEQEEYDEEQRLEREKAARQEELERQERERQRQEEARLLQQTRGLGVPITIHRIGTSGRFGERNLDEITPEIVGHLKSVKDLFLKHLPHQIKKIEWIINPRLQEQFEDTRRKLQNAGRGTKEVILFHGTVPANVQS